MSVVEVLAALIICSIILAGIALIVRRSDPEVIEEEEEEEVRHEGPEERERARWREDPPESDTHYAGEEE